MFDIGIGFSELLLLAVITIIVVGPEDLPALLRTIGRYAGQVRRVADEFRREFNEALKETELDKLDKSVDELKGRPGDYRPDENAGADGDVLIDFEEHNRKVLEKEQAELVNDPARTRNFDAGESLADVESEAEDWSKDEEGRPGSKIGASS